MDIVKSRKDNRLSSFSAGEGTGVEVPENFSRGKALQYLKNREAKHAKAHKNTINKMYELYLRIGATGELPDTVKHTEYFLSDFWCKMYLENNLVPSDIPFDVVIDVFSGALMRGEAHRKGNNQAAICEAFNDWVTKPDVRNRLYAERDRQYPSNKPKQIEQTGSYASTQDEAEMNAAIRGKKVEEWPDEVIVSQANKIAQIWQSDIGKQIIGLGGKAYRSRIFAEMERRGIEREVVG